MAITAKPPPPLDIPSSTSTVNVHIIDSTARIKGIPVSMFMVPKYRGLDVLDCPAFSFLVEHVSTGRKILFDLGVNPNWESGPKVIADRIKGNGWNVTTKKGVAEILTEGGVNLEDIEAIIWSHHHWDHTGDPSTFPPSTSLIVGPGFTPSFTPGFPTNPTSPILESAYTGRELRELSFANSPLTIGGCKAIDFFNDGSFYLLDTPGHSVGHMCALARTTAQGEGSFLFLGGDVAHHGGEVRPTGYLPLPGEVEVEGGEGLGMGGRGVCPGDVFARAHRLWPGEGAWTEPFALAGEVAAKDVEEARESVRKVGGFDAHPNILLMLAHDDTMLDVVDLFPQSTANKWMEKGWKEKGLWRFLADFKEAAEEKLGSGGG